MSSPSVASLVKYSDFFRLSEFISFTDVAFLIVGGFLSVVSGAALVHFVAIVGRILNIFILVDSESNDFRVQVTPSVLYFCAASLIASFIVVLQYACFRMVGLKVARRIRREYLYVLAEKPLSYYEHPVNAAVNARFEADVLHMLAAVTEAVPATIATLAQVVVAVVISVTHCVELFWPVAGFALFSAAWFLFFNYLTVALGKKEAQLAEKTAHAIKNSSAYLSHANARWTISLWRHVFIGIVTGTTWFFLYSGMGFSQAYANILLDSGVLRTPGHSFILACSLMPAAAKLGQLPFHISNILGAARAPAWIRHLRDPASSRPLADDDQRPPPEYWPSPEGKRKSFMITFFQNELLGVPVRLYPRNGTAFSHLRSTARSKWITYGGGFVLAIFFAAAPPMFTKLNGDLFEMYVGRAVSAGFFDEGIFHGWRYLVVGSLFCFLGFVSTLMFAYNGEHLAHEIRCATFWHFMQRYGAARATAVGEKLVSLLTTVTDKCKAAFDSRLCQFTVAVGNLAFGVAFVFEKNVVTAIVCSVIFALQAISQFFVIHMADIHTKVALEKKNALGRSLLEQFKLMHEAEVGGALPRITEQHDHYLSLNFHRHVSVVVAQGMKFSFAVAVPQVAQAVGYTAGAFLILDGLVRPIVVYKIVQTLHICSFAISFVAQFYNIAQVARYAAMDLDDVLPKPPSIMNPTTISTVSSGGNGEPSNTSSEALA